MPGVIDTPRNRADMPDADFAQWVRPEQMAEVIGFLASEASSAIHGASVPVRGLS
jgi:NAD(P)-dependent dehydrogenase (short-subunit alcohol dehydrogenase family)